MAEPTIPKIITHANMEPLLEALTGEPEFRPGPVPPGQRFGGEWYRRRVRLEFPLGELAEAPLKTIGLVGFGGGYATAAIRGDERFNAQGLEGKAVVEKDLFSALMNLRDLLPEYRGRIVVG